MYPESQLRHIIEGKDPRLIPGPKASPSRPCLGWHSQHRMWTISEAMGHKNGAKRGSSQLWKRVLHYFILFCIHKFEDTKVSTGWCPAGWKWSIFPYSAVFKGVNDLFRGPLTSTRHLATLGIQTKNKHMNPQGRLGAHGCLRGDWPGAGYIWISMICRYL